MACNFKFENYIPECANTSGIRAVALLPKSKVTGPLGYKVDKVNSIPGATTDDWGKMSIKPGKGNITLAATIDAKKDVYLNVYTMIFNLNKFNAIITADTKSLNDEIYAAVLLNNGTAYLLGDGGADVLYEECRITAIASNTGAALGDATSTDITVKFTTDGYVSELDLTVDEIAAIFGGTGDVIVEKAPAAAAKA